MGICGVEAEAASGGAGWRSCILAGSNDREEELWGKGLRRRREEDLSGRAPASRGWEGSREELPGGRHLDVELRRGASLSAAGEGLEATARGGSAGEGAG